MGVNQFDQALEDLGTEGQSPFEAALGSVAAEDAQAQRSKVTAATKVAAATTPERMAEAAQIGRQMGLPTSFVERNLDAMKARLSSDALAQLQQDAPRLSDWLTDPTNAALAQDDHAPLTSIERLLGVGRNVAGAAGAGLVSVASGLYAIPRAVGDVVGSESLSAESARKAQALDAIAARVRGPQTGAGFVEQSVYGGIESLGQMAPALILGVISGGTSLLTSVGLTAGGTTYNQARDQGQTLGKSLTAGGIQGALEVLTEFVPAHRLLGDLAKNSGLIKTLSHQILPELAGEEIATATQDLNEFFLLPANKDKTFTDYLRERPSAAAATAISTIVAVGATTAAAHGTQRFIEKLGEAATASKTVQRSPEAAEAFIAQAAAESGAETLFAPIDTFTTYWQTQGLDPRVVATELTGSPIAYDTAIATGEDLAIPTAAYAVRIAPTEHNAFFAREVRLSPEQMNMREAEAFTADLQAQTTETPAADTVPATEAPSAAQDVTSSVVQQLTAAGFTPQTAESYATLYAAAFGTLGQRAGVDPAQLFNRYGLTINREGLDSGLAPAQTSTSDALPAVPQEAAAAGDGAINDAGTTSGSETAGDGAGSPALRRVAESVAPGKRESARAREQRRTDHYADVWGAVLDAARVVDPAVDEAALRATFDERLAYLEEADAAYQEAGHNPRHLLEAIAKYGGISADREQNGGMSGELAWIKESPARGPYGNFGGVAGVFQTRSLNSNGTAKTGLSLDDMARMLSQDPEFGIAEVPDLLAALEDISRLGTVGQKGAVNFPGTRELRQRAGIHLERAWWQPQTFNQAATRLGSLATAPGPNESRLVPFPTLDTREASRLFRAADFDHATKQTINIDDLIATQQTVSQAVVREKLQGTPALPLVLAYQGKFYLADGTHTATAAWARGDEQIDVVAAPVSEDKLATVLYQSPQQDALIFDTLDTGEQQARLPEAGDVRDQNVQTPQFEAPFALTSETAKPNKAVQQTTLFQAFFHGSPHDFVRFSLDKIGTGEGAQAYGWGLYFAENRSIAAGYFDRLSGNPTIASMKLGTLLMSQATGMDYSRRASESDLENIRASLAEDILIHELDAIGAGTGGFQQYVLGLVDQRIKDYEQEWPEAVSVAQRLRAELARHGAVSMTIDKVSGGVYQVEIPDEHVAMMLDWDKPLAKQAKPVRDALKAAGVAKRYKANRSDFSAPMDTRGIEARGENLYAFLQREQGGSEQASKYLLSIGIPGVKYLDADSRDAGKGTRNVVVFDDAIVKLTHKDGTPVTAQERKEYFQGPQDKRGSLSFGTDRQMAINLFEKADLSTFLHESGHFFLEVLRDLETQSSDIKADLDTLRTWFGTDEIGVDQHEQFARGFEAYLMEGKAPSTALRGVFARFRSWLTGVYRSIRGLNVTLTPEVRRVFDRLLASEDAIVQAEDEGQVFPLFIDAASAGMTAEAFDVYRQTVERGSQEARDQLASRVLADLQREQAAWWKAEKETTRTAVAAELGAQPVYQALAAIQKGQQPDGSPFGGAADAVPMKMDKAALAERYTAEEMTALRRRQLYTVEGGIHPDELADFFGFSSGDELVRALIAAKPFKAAVEAETQRRMVEKHGDLVLDKVALHEQAQRAVVEQQTAVVQAELKALTSAMVKGTIPPADVLNRAAADRIAQMRPRDIKPGQFLMAARRASRRAFELLSTNNDRVGAVQAKQQELLNLALYREATAAKDQAQAVVAHGRQLMKPAAQMRLGKAGESYQDAVLGILDRYELATVPQKVLDRRSALRDWVAAQEAQSLPVDLPESVLNEARRVNWREITMEELRGVDEALRQIEHLARLKNRLLKSADQREFAAVVTDLVVGVQQSAPPVKPRALEARLPQDQASRMASVFFAASRKFNNQIAEFDGWQIGGTFWEHLVRPLNAAADAEAEQNADASRRLSALFDAYQGEERTLYQKTYIPAIGDSLSKMSRLMVALHWGNAFGRDRLTSDRVRGWDAAKVQAILDTLDARDVQWVNDAWALLDSYWPEIEAKQRRVFGVAPEKVEALPFTAKGGTFTGGYAPKLYEGQLSAKSQSQIEGQFADSLKQASYVTSTTRRGHTKQSVEHYSEPLRLDFGVLSEHLTNVIHDLTHHEALIDVTRLLGNKEIQDAIYTHYGDVVYDQLKGLVRDVAQGQAPAPSWLRPLNALRQGGVVARLGWSVVTTALQPFQSVMAIPYFGSGLEGTKWLLKGYGRWAADAASMQNSVTWMRERSTFMRTRGLTQFREINEMRNRIGLDQGRVSGWMHDGLAALKVPPSVMPAIADSFFYLIQKGQQLADVPVWLAAYEQAMDAAGTPTSAAHAAEIEDRAVALADQAVIDTQGSGHIKDLSAVERQSALKFLTTFYSFQNILLQATVKSVKRVDLKTARGLSRLAIDAFVLLFAQQVIESQVRSVFGRQGGDDDDDTTLTERMIRAGLSQFVGLFVGARELQGPIQGFGYSGPAGFQWASDLARLGDQVAQGESDPAFWKALNNVGGDFLQYPAAQVQKTAEGLQAIMDGRTKNPLVLLTGAKAEQ